MLGKEGNPGKLCSFAKGQEIRGMEGLKAGGLRCSTGYLIFHACCYTVWPICKKGVGCWEVGGVVRPCSLGTPLHLSNWGAANPPDAHRQPAQVGYC